MTRWLDDHEQAAWRSFLRMRSRLHAELHRRLQAESGLSISDFDVLVALTDRPDGRVRVLELAAALDWEKSRLSHHLARMRTRGLLTREECGDDGRGHVVVLTAEGRAAIERAAPGHVETVRELVFDALPAGDVEALARISAAVLDRLDDPVDPGDPVDRGGPGGAR
ncbi:MarR family winged helix-turn-helix transcriptional regulator [Pseudonocardia sp. HH130630-07]|uniref:MarR family winged helix-turn-helix transcriptional regulator n=1 Tax=Pseudonocardia sp. HH130630-07 TaxID=1690815 RepID=UPI000814F2CA|nr:MarR family winged helix-turn-helix transcriptional regulator [Pseudonocardia sp. HH130630-07]ANY07102.1 MarR family transcriptional regulator [Pseudonocardia sp. HH130630-07]